MHMHLFLYFVDILCFAPLTQQQRLPAKVSAVTLCHSDWLSCVRAGRPDHCVFINHHPLQCVFTFTVPLSTLCRYTYMDQNSRNTWRRPQTHHSAPVAGLFMFSKSTQSWAASSLKKNRWHHNTQVLRLNELFSKCYLVKVCEFEFSLISVCVINIFTPKRSNIFTFKWSVSNCHKWVVHLCCYLILNQLINIVDFYWIGNH